ncbi:MAG: ribonuclease III [Bryobacteraceae bacterium]
MSAPLELLEERLDYRFRNRSLLFHALTHRSWSVEHRDISSALGDNERLEFLGDSVLGFVVSEALLDRFPGESEGQLSQRKAHLVSSNHLYACALELKLGEFLLLGKGEEQNGGRARRTVLANAVEAVIAAMHLDGGLEPVREFIRRTVLREQNEGSEPASGAAPNYKSVLQEEAQARGWPVPRYTIVDTTGPEHAKVFLIEATIGDQFSSRAAGSSKKAASQDAARLLVQQLEK